MASWRILAFDIENKPVSYNGDWPTAHITAIAACWVDQPESIRYWPVTFKTVAKQLERFRAVYDKADIVTGHYIRKHDLPIINGRMMTNMLSPLGQKMTLDTKLDWLKKKDVSATLENLLKYYGIEHGKAHLSAADWEAINEGDVAGQTLLKERCVGDVIAQAALFRKMVSLDHLGAPKMWRP